MGRLSFEPNQLHGPVTYDAVVIVCLEEVG